MWDDELKICDLTEVNWHDGVLAPYANGWAFMGGLKLIGIMGV